MLLYRRLSSPLHAARTGVGALWIAALIAAVLLLDHPLILAALAFAVLAAGALAGVGYELARVARAASALALPLIAVNAIASRQGLTVFARLGDLGPFGQGDLTLEALVYGLTMALKVTVVMLLCALGSLALDPDELLRALRRVSFRSSLSISLAIRMTAVLSADARRLAEAQRTRPGTAPRRRRAQAALVGALVSRSLDRALEVAATLELRGFARGKRPQRRQAAWSHRDLAFAAAALAAISLALLGRIAKAGSFTAYPLLSLPIHTATWTLGAALCCAVLLPFGGRRKARP